MQKSYFLRISGREEGPIFEEQVAQMFSDQRVNRDTPCRLASGGEWKAIDDYMPMLKYGTQLPPATPKPITPVSVVPSGTPTTTQQIAIVDIDIPFVSLLKMMFKWVAASLIVGCCLFLLWLLTMLIFFVFGAGIGALHHS